MRSTASDRHTDAVLTPMPTSRARSSVTTMRTATNDDHAAIIALTEARLPMLPSSESRFPFDYPDMTTSLEVRVVEDAGEIVAVGWLAAFTYARPGSMFLNVVVAQDHERQGIGSRLHTALRVIVPPTTTRLAARIFTADDRPTEIAQHWGFAVDQRSVASILDLSGAADLASSSPQPDGLSFDDSSTLAFPDEAAVDAMYQRSQTNPETATEGVWSLDRARSALAGEPRAVGTVVRIDGTPAGISFGGVGAGEFIVHYTGIDPHFRGRGLASLLKRHIHASGAAAGATTAITHNEEHNTGIRRVNAELGYRIAWIETRLSRAL